MSSYRFSLRADQDLLDIAAYDSPRCGEERALRYSLAAALASTLLP